MPNRIKFRVAFRKISFVVRMLVEVVVGLDGRVDGALASKHAHPELPIRATRSVDPYSIECWKPIRSKRPFALEKDHGLIVCTVIPERQSLRGRVTLLIPLTRSGFGGSGLTGIVIVLGVDKCGRHGVIGV